MPTVIVRPAWHLPERRVTPEGVWASRRRFLSQLGCAGLGLAGVAPGGQAADAPVAVPQARGYPHRRNPDFDPKVRLTDEKTAGQYNNFYEFTLQKDVHRHVAKFEVAPWKIEVGGLVEQPAAFDLDELLEASPLEERVYRLRCVEAWAMIVPWTGFPFLKLAEKVRPRAEAKFVRFLTAARPEQMPGLLKYPDYPWPYFEGLRLDEALHPLTLLATGIYGKPLPKQHGAPVRLVVPWYGYKSIKSVVKIEFVAQQPPTFWETLQPEEYPFESNVDPAVPHPRWSQATERLIDTGDRVKTKKYNGYGDLVAKLYS